VPSWERACTQPDKKYGLNIFKLYAFSASMSKVAAYGLFCAARMGIFFIVITLIQQLELALQLFIGFLAVQRNFFLKILRKPSRKIKRFYKVCFAN
jgi:hypothetical protein